MDSRLHLKDLIATLAYSLSHDEQVRAIGRLLLIVIAIAAVGIVGGQIVQGITPPTERYVEREPGNECI